MITQWRNYQNQAEQNQATQDLSPEEKLNKNLAYLELTLKTELAKLDDELKTAQQLKNTEDISKIHNRGLLIQGEYELLKMQMTTEYKEQINQQQTHLDLKYIDSKLDKINKGMFLHIFIVCLMKKGKITESEVNKTQIGNMTLYNINQLDIKGIQGNCLDYVNLYIDIIKGRCLSNLADDLEKLLIIIDMDLSEFKNVYEEENNKFENNNIKDMLDLQQIKEIDKKYQEIIKQHGIQNIDLQQFFNFNDTKNKIEFKNCFIGGKFMNTLQKNNCFTFLGQTYEPEITLNFLNCLQKQIHEFQSQQKNKYQSPQQIIELCESIIAGRIENINSLNYVSEQSMNFVIDFLLNKIPELCENIKDQNSLVELFNVLLVKSKKNDQNLEYINELCQNMITRTQKQNQKEIMLNTLTKMQEEITLQQHLKWSKQQQNNDMK